MGSRGFHDFIHHYRYKLYIYSTYTYYICIKLSMKRNCTRRVIILRNALLPFCLRDARGSSANISAKGFQLHLWLFSLCLCFVPFYPSLSLSRSLALSRASCVHRQIAFRFCAQVVSLQPHCALRPCG